MKYYCNEDARNLVELEIKNRKDALKLYDKIIEVAERFNGKVLNKRFETALKKVDERLSCDRRYSCFEIKMCVFDSRCCKSVNKDDLGYSCTNYITDNYLILNGYLPTYSYNPNDEVLLYDERIISSVLIKSLSCGRKHMEETIISLEKSLDKIPEWKERLKILRDEMEKTMKEIPSIIREYYNINYRVENR